MPSALDGGAQALVYWAEWLSTITFIEENWTRAGEARLPLYTDATMGLRDSVTATSAVAGWLHSPRNVPAAAPVR